MTEALKKMLTELDKKSKRRHRANSQKK